MDSVDDKTLLPGVRLVTSPNLKQGSVASVLGEEIGEFPGLVELMASGNGQNSRWALWGADGRYWVCRFKGQTLTKVSGPYPGDFGTNFYAAQASEGLPDRRVILLSWLQGVRYPEMPFNSPE